VTIPHDWHLDGIPSVAGRHELARFGQAFIDSLASGQTLVVPDIATSAETKARFEAFEAIGIRSLVNLPLIERGRLTAILFVHDTKARHWKKDDVQFLQDVADRTWSAAERARSEEHRKLLTAELQHRVKNLLAMVQAIANQTLKNAKGIADAQQSLVERLIVLSDAHDILTRANWTTAPIGEIIERGLTSYRNDPGRFKVAGPYLELAAKPALALTLAIHELCTNAVKYGALSGERGWIEITWSVEGEGPAATFTLRWEEHDGPSVTPPTRKGFGSRMIDRAFSSEFNGKVGLTYEPTGVIWTVTAPLMGIRNS
jgi:two-component sensor histidine kinase